MWNLRFVLSAILAPLFIVQLAPSQTKPSIHAFEARSAGTIAQVSASRVSISVSPVAAEIFGGSAQPFAAIVHGSQNQAVTWSVEGIAGGNSSVGTISATGRYNPPAGFRDVTTVLIKAVSVANPSATATVTAMLRPPARVTITLSPSNFTLGVGANQQFTATVSGSSNKNVTWTVNGVANGNSTYGTLDSATGLYFAPTSVPNPGTYSITATASADTNKSATTQVTIAASDPLGSVTKSVAVSCPGGGLGGSTCKKLTVSCDNVANQSTYLKINYPTGSALGAVLFGVGTGGSGLYDTKFTYGQNTVQNVLNAGFTAVQISFGAPFTSTTPNGWLEGPGGVRRLACRYATATQWVHDNILVAGEPLCATGNSGGASAIGYALSEYGLSGTISMAEVTSGPPMARLDYGCLCNQAAQDTPCGQGLVSQCYGVSNAGVIDTAYPTSLCTNAVNGNPRPIDATLFFSDSVSGPGAVFNLPKTYVNVLFGGQDSSSAVPIAQQWYDSITTTTKKAQGCVHDAPHSMPDVLDAANQISSDIISLCKIQP